MVARPQLSRVWGRRREWLGADDADGVPLELSRDVVRRVEETLPSLLVELTVRDVQRRANCGYYSPPRQATLLILGLVRR